MNFYSYGATASSLTVGYVFFSEMTHIAYIKNDIKGKVQTLWPVGVQGLEVKFKRNEFLIKFAILMPITQRAPEVTVIFVPKTNIEKRSFSGPNIPKNCRNDVCLMQIKNFVKIVPTAQSNYHFSQRQKQNWPKTAIQGNAIFDFLFFSKK